MMGTGLQLFAGPSLQTMDMRIDVVILPWVLARRTTHRPYNAALIQGGEDVEPSTLQNTKSNEVGRNLVLITGLQQLIAAWITVSPKPCAGGAAMR